MVLHISRPQPASSSVSVTTASQSLLHRHHAHLPKHLSLTPTQLIIQITRSLNGDPLDYPSRRVSMAPYSNPSLRAFRLERTHEFPHPSLSSGASRANGQSQKSSPCSGTQPCLPACWLCVHVRSMHEGCASVSTRALRTFLDLYGGRFAVLPGAKDGRGTESRSC